MRFCSMRLIRNELTSSYAEFDSRVGRNPVDNTGLLANNQNARERRRIAQLRVIHQHCAPCLRPQRPIQSKFRMATSTLQIGSPGKTRWVLRSVLLAAALVIVALAAVVGWLYLGARSALPQLDGTITLPGLSAAVTVTRDTHGVPTIDASSLHDLFFAQGYVTAQDRLWQMDVMRRYAGGEISEILGPKFIAHDREQRILGLRAAARHALQGVSPRDREFFEDYARGVNAYIDSHLGDLPLEFRILRYSPKIWTMEDSILMGARMVQDLNHYSYRRALEREKILAKLGPELTADLYVNSSWRDHPPSAKSARIDQQQERDGDDSDTDSSVAQADTDRKLRAILPITG